MENINKYFQALDHYNAKNGALQKSIWETVLTGVNSIVEGIETPDLGAQIAGQIAAVFEAQNPSFWGIKLLLFDDLTALLRHADIGPEDIETGVFWLPERKKYLYFTDYEQISGPRSKW